MPRYYCDYCDTYLTHDSPSVRRQHNSGYKHKANVRNYYMLFEELQPGSILPSGGIVAHYDTQINMNTSALTSLPPHMQQVVPPIARPQIPQLIRPGFPPANIIPPGLGNNAARPIPIGTANPQAQSGVAIPPGIGGQQQQPFQNVMYVQPTSFDQQGSVLSQPNQNTNNSILVGSNQVPQQPLGMNLFPAPQLQQPPPTQQQLQQQQQSAESQPSMTNIVKNEIS